MCRTGGICRILALGLAISGPLALAGKSKFNAVLAPGDAAPAWRELAGTDGKRHSLEDYQSAKVLVVVFTSNRCPVARGYEERLAEFAKAWKNRGVEVVAINVGRHPSESLEKMAVRATERKFPFPYLSDPAQKTGEAYGVRVSLQTFVLDQKRRIAYLGAFDDSNDPQKVRRNYVADAVEAVLAGKDPAVRESLPRGCAVDYGDAPARETDE